MTGTIGVTAGSAVAIGVGTAWLTEIKPNDYLTIGGYTEPVKSVESNTALTLWSGSRQTISGSAATIKQLSKYRIKLFGQHQVSADFTVPIGVDLSVVGAPTTGAGIVHTPYASGAAKRFVLPANHCGKLLFQGLSNTGNYTYTDSLVVGALVSGRGIIEIAECNFIGASTTLATQCAAFTFRDLDLNNSRWYMATDYSFFEDVYQYGDGGGVVSDWGFYATIGGFIATDTGHEIIWNRVTIHNDTPVISSTMNGGFEHNGCPAGKTHRFSNCEAIMTGREGVAGSTSIFLLWHGTTNNGDYYFTDCVVDSPNLTSDIWNESVSQKAATVVRTYRQDGSATRVLYTTA